MGDAAIRDAAVLVTGGTGSFGQAFVRRCLEAGARRVVVFSRDELKQSIMAQSFSDERLRFFIGDVGRATDRLYWAMDGIDIVCHAAAMKRIEVCERDGEEAVFTNVMGTINVAKAAIRAGVQKAVMLSTDKAPAAHTLYGASKFLAERVWCGLNAYAAHGQTRLSATRYGNVLNSRGSVLHLWREQASRGEPLTITDAKCTRFWMSIDQAVDLVLLALTEMRGGEVFVPAVPSAPILALAHAVAPNASISETGMRGAERLHETLISPEEARTTYAAPGWYVIEPEVRSWGDVEPLPYPKVPDGWSYRSDHNPQQFTVEDLAELVAA